MDTGTQPSTMNGTNSISDARNRVIFPLQKTRFNGRFESGKDFEVSLAEWPAIVPWSNGHRGSKVQVLTAADMIYILTIVVVTMIVMMVVVVISRR